MVRRRTKRTKKGKKDKKKKAKDKLESIGKIEKEEEPPKVDQKEKKDKKDKKDKKGKKEKKEKKEKHTAEDTTKKENDNDEKCEDVDSPTENQADDAAADLPEDVSPSKKARLLLSDSESAAGVGDDAEEGDGLLQKEVDGLLGAEDEHDAKDDDGSLQKTWSYDPMARTEDPGHAKENGDSLPKQEAAAASGEMNQKRIHPADKDKRPYTYEEFMKFAIGDDKKAQKMWSESMPADETQDEKAVEDQRWEKSEESWKASNDAGDDAWKADSWKDEKKGQSEKWWHKDDPDVPDSEKPCRDFQRGKCWRENCKFSHDEKPTGQDQSSRQASSSSWKNWESDKKDKWQKDEWPSSWDGDKEKKTLPSESQNSQAPAVAATSGFSDDVPRRKIREWQAMGQHVWPYDMVEWQEFQEEVWPGFPPLRPGFIRCWSRSQDVTYYVNMVNMASQFEAPLAPQALGLKFQSPAPAVSIPPEDAAVLTPPDHDVFTPPGEDEPEP